MDPHQQKGELQPNDWTLLRSTEYYCTFLEASPWDWANPLLWNILGVDRRIPKALGSNVFINAHFHPLGTKQFPPVCTSVFTFRIWGLRGGKPVSVSHTVLKDLLHHSVIATQHSIIANLQQNSFNKPLHYSKSAQHCSADSASSWSSWLETSWDTVSAATLRNLPFGHLVHMSFTNAGWKCTSQLQYHPSLEQTLKNHQSPTFQRSIRAWNYQNITLLSVLPFPQHVRQKCILVQHGVATWRSIALSLISWASVPPLIWATRTRRADRGWPWHLWRCRTWLLRHLRTLWCLSWELRWAQRHLGCWSIFFGGVGSNKISLATTKLEDCETHSATLLLLRVALALCTLHLLGWFGPLEGPRSTSILN